MRWWNKVNFVLNNIRYVVQLWVLVWSLLAATAQAQPTSVLAEGSWRRLSTTQTGIYKITAPLLRRMGFDLTTLNPQYLQLYGNGGAMLPQANSAPRSRGLTQQAVWVTGQDDGRFDENDVLYFYAESPHQVVYDSTRAAFRHQINYYADTTYYFLTAGKAPGLRVTGLASINAEGGDVVDQFDDYWYHEEESVNLLQSGREWWGEYLGLSSQLSLPVPLTGLVPGTEARLLTRAIASAQVATRFRWQVNGQEVGEQPVGTVSTYRYDLRAQIAEKDYLFKVPASPPSAFSVGVQFDKGGQANAQAYLDYIALQIRRRLQQYDGQQVYRFLPAARDTVQYRIQTTSPDWIWWDVTVPLHPRQALLQRTSTGIAQFGAQGARQVRTYVGFLPQQALEPPAWQPVPNQNIYASTVPDLLIVSARAWEKEAQRLAQHRRQHDGLDVLVVTTDQVYNEFASGRADVSAIRDFARHLYQQAPDKLKYLLLLGDATYDYRNRSRTQSAAQQQGWVPVYESRESLHPVFTYSSDDYFGFMKDREGYWQESTSGDHTLDIGTGRLPVKTADEARVVVDKLIHYDTSPRTRGAWRNRIGFVADDGDGNIHQQHADELAGITQPYLLPQRLFIDAFPQLTTPEGPKAPELNAAIGRNIEEGTLILNYTGHGGISGWAEEQVLTLADIQSLRGYNNMPLLVTATCEFGRYDDPALVSGAELMVLSPRGAAIGAVTTTRPVFASTNFALNKAFYEVLTTVGTSARMGDIVRITKNRSLSGSLNRNFTLLGDPSMRLARPEYEIQWEAIADTLRALQKVKLTGRVVQKGSASAVSTFEGTARVTLFDKPVSFRTAGSESTPATYSEYRSRLFDGQVSIRNGRFNVEFVVPRNIDYRLGKGRISVYAVSTDSLSDAAAQLGVVVGGSENSLTDRTPPQIRAYLNDSSFRDGQVVPASSVLWIEASDESGINVSQAGLGHELLATLNDSTTFVLNDYFVAHTDDYQRGTIRFPLEGLPPGHYTVHVKIWDTYTNSSETTLRFIVGPESGIKLVRAHVFPNPFQEQLSFELEHTRDSEDIEVFFRILSVSGQTLCTYRWIYYTSEKMIREAIQPKDLSSLLPTGFGMYLYELSVRSVKDGSTDRRSGKLLMAR
ncbi:type IX secretion system sortase PorU [Telluribacter sp. SYSU D00476]|uniref:type IX secretion system sortase PorU n=1 Tax=Telluribacter sp. SYSU D00476 TaxID=2811430 RepID=UPI001FF47D07|nr:type IX secretion system sortase PorU [Telluribacter sp. SYSU D00476]